MPRLFARIDLDAFVHNVRLVRRRLPKGCGMMAVVKADAYGHGIESVARAAEAAGVEYLGAATVDEGQAIRRAGVRLPVLLLDPVLPYEVRSAVGAALQLSIDTLEGARVASKAARSLHVVAAVHVPVDLGMRRFGVSVPGLATLVSKAATLRSLRVEGISGHVPRADSEQPEDQTETRAALASLRAALCELDGLGLLPPLRHVANSAAVIQYTAEVTSHPFNLIRIGTLLYGYPEVARPWTASIRPVATLTTRVLAVREVERGESVGYDRSWKAPRACRIAVLAAGYADGLPPALGNHGCVLLRGRQAPIVGRVCLNHAFADVTEIEGVGFGDVGTVFGPDHPADRAAAMAGLSVCELLVPSLRSAERTTA